MSRDRQLSERGSVVVVGSNQPIPLEEFLRDNPDLADDEVASVRGLAVGEAYVFGGGAAEAIAVTRVG